MTSKDVFEEQQFNLSCMSHKISKHVTYTLYKDNKPLTDGHFFRFVASKASSGLYYCEAKANGITKVSMPLVINVKGKKTIQLSVYGINIEYGLN